MRELAVDLWNVPADLRVITTNGYVAKSGCAVMGRGCAREARDRYPELAFKFGQLLKKYGNRTMRLGVYDEIMLCSLPVKRYWRDYADLALIERSTEQLVAIANKFRYEHIVLPRPGCGNGGLAWSAVKLALEPLLDERFTVVRYQGEAA